MKSVQKKHYQRIRRHVRIRKVIHGTHERPRLSIFRSNRHIWAQLIDDVNHTTIASATDWRKKAHNKKTAKNNTRVAQAQRVGEEIGKIAVEKNITLFVFDRGGNKYHGRVKAVADGARKAGIQL